MTYHTDEGGKLAKYSGDVPLEAINAIEAADEQSIIEKMTRVDAQSAFAYSYPVRTKEGTKDIIGVSVDGAKEIANLLGNIKVSSEIKVEERDDHFYAIVPVTNLIRNVTLIGAGAQSKYILGERNEPTDRIDVLAFVKAISKAQRNGILSIAPQETIAAIMSKLDTKSIKRLPAPPSYPAAQKLQPAKAAPAKAPATKTTEEDALKKLRQQVGIEASKVFPTDDDRKIWQKMEYGVDSMTELDEEQLKDMLTKVKDLGQPAKPSITELGFSSENERVQMKEKLIELIRSIGYSSNEEVIKYAADKGWRKTYEATKDELESYIEEVERDKKAIDEAEGIPENI